jgi:hypothetical protein
MRTTEHDGTGAIAICLIVFICVAGLGALGGYWLMQPRVIPNLGLAAYKPPPATRLIPLPRKMDAPELVELPAPADVPEPKFDQPQRTTVKATVASPKPIAPRAQPKSPHLDDATSAYAYSGRWGYDERRYYERRYVDRSERGWSSWRGGWNGRW